MSISSTDRKGFLEVSGNGHYFVKDGEPFFWLGDTIWPAPSAYSDEELEFYFKRRHEQGFTIAHITLPYISFDGVFAAVPGASADDMPMWRNNNPATPNEEYFERVDRIIRRADKFGLLLSLGPCGGGGGTLVDRYKLITVDNARPYGRWLAERYKDFPNIVWSAGFDVPPWCFEDIAIEFTAGIKEGGDEHILFYHPCGGTSSNHFHNEDWLSANMIQTWAAYELIPKMVTADYHRKPYKPIVLAEGAYEAGTEYPTKPITARLARRQAYASYLSGGFHTYGHNDFWRKTPYWRECLESKGAKSMSVLKDFLTSLEWWKITPYQSLFDAWVSEAHSAAISEDGDFAIVYFAHREELPIRTGRVCAGEPVRAVWVDPENGNRTDAGLINEQVHAFTSPPSCDDAILLLTSE